MITENKNKPFEMLRWYLIRVKKTGALYAATHPMTSAEYLKACNEFKDFQRDGEFNSLGLLTKAEMDAASLDFDAAMKAFQSGGFRDVTEEGIWQ